MYSLVRQNVVVLRFLWAYIVPMRIWNTSSSPFTASCVQLTSYLWGFETQKNLFQLKFGWGLHRTYEDLKQETPSMIANSPRAYIVPMRIWNEQRNGLDGVIFALTSYLWGFETVLDRRLRGFSYRLHRTYEDLKRSIATRNRKYFLAYIVPMRIWNKYDMCNHFWE